VTRAVFFVLSATAMACGLTMGPLVASHDEYRIWRSARLETQVERKARLLHRYLAEYPRGHFAKKAEREERALDERYYSAGMTEIAGLRAYLAVFPEGVHADQARYRLGQLVQMEGARAREVAEVERRRAQMEATLEENRRAWCARTIETWLSVLAGVSGWGDPLDVVLSHNVTLATAWNGDPAPACDGDLCTKDLPHHYYIQVRGATRVDKDMKIRIRLRLAAGTGPEEPGRRLVGAELGLPDRGLLSCEELAQQVEIDPQDAEAVGRARTAGEDRLALAVRAAFPEPPAPSPPAATAAPTAPAPRAPAAATVAPAAPNPLRLVSLERPPLVVEVWRAAGAAAEGAPTSPLESDGVRIVWQAPAPAHPGPRPPTKAPPTKAPPTKAPPTKAPARAPAKVPPR
jgi:hypothetical protein